MNPMNRIASLLIVAAGAGLSALFAQAPTAAVTQALKTAEPHLAQDQREAFVAAVEPVLAALPEVIPTVGVGKANVYLRRVFTDGNRLDALRFRAPGTGQYVFFMALVLPPGVKELHYGTARAGQYPATLAAYPPLATADLAVSLVNSTPDVRYRGGEEYVLWLQNSEAAPMTIALAISLVPVDHPLLKLGFDPREVSGLY